MFQNVSEFVQDALHRKVASQRASQAIFWGSLNSVILSALIYDIIYSGWTHSNNLLWWLAAIASFGCLLNIVIHLKSYITVIFTIKPLQVTDKQRKLLSVSDSDIGFQSQSPIVKQTEPETKTTSPKLSSLFEASIRTPPPQQLQSTTLSSPSKSWLSASPHEAKYGSFASSNNSLYSNNSYLNLSSGVNASTSPSVAVNTWSFNRNQSPFLDSSYNIINSPKHDSTESPGSPSLGSRLRSPTTSSPLPFSSRRSITSKQELEQYLADFQDKERRKQILSQTQNGNGGSNSLWAYNSTNDQDALNTLRNNVYQIAVKDEGHEVSSSNNKNESFKTTNLSTSSVSKIWLKRNITPKILFQYEENFRMWVSLNILQPLVKLIDSTNESIATTAPEFQIGQVGVDKLRKAAHNMTGVKQIFNLLPFIDLSIHQDYLVKRLRELSRGGAISAFQWNGGGHFNGKPWRDEYPTDTYILLHLFALYMDNHLPPDPTQPDGRVFSNLHIVKTPEKPPKPAAHPYLFLTQVNPPHLKVVLPGEEECEVGLGHKNFIHAMLLFCHFIVHEQHSHIAGLNLNLSGINLAWVLNSE